MCPTSLNLTKKERKKAVAKQVERPEQQHPPSYHPYFPYIITGVFFILSLTGIFHHEMWRDEYQAWMVAAEAHSIPELFANLKYEGNPVLWHAFLFLITSLTDDPFWMQFFHILVSSSFIFLISRYAPFTMLQKVLLSFGYYTFYEYNLISRGYGLGLLLIVIFCILYSQRQKYLLWMAAVLFLLCNSTIFGIILSVCFSGMILYEIFFLSKKSTHKSLKNTGWFIAIVGLGIILGYLQIQPEEDNSFPALYVTGYDAVRLKWAFSRLIHAYFPVPDFTTLHFWNKNFFVPVEKEFLAGITPLFIVGWLLAYLRYRAVLLLYAIGTLILLVFYYYTGFIWSRYAGHLFLLLLACQWLLFYQKEKTFKNSFVDRWSIIGNKIRTPYFYLILAVSFAGGVIAYSVDLSHPFSASSQASKYIRNNGLDQYEIIGSLDYLVSPLAAQLGKDIIYPERKEHGSFIIWDQKRQNRWSFQEVEDMLVNMNQQGQKKMLLVMSSPIQRTSAATGESVPWKDTMLTDKLRMTLASSFRPGIVEDEKYFIYLIEETGVQ